MLIQVAWRRVESLYLPIEQTGVQALRQGNCARSCEKHQRAARHFCGQSTLLSASIAYWTRCLTPRVGTMLLLSFSRDLTRCFGLLKFVPPFSSSTSWCFDLLQVKDGHANEFFDGEAHLQEANLLLPFAGAQEQACKRAGGAAGAVQAGAGRRSAAGRARKGRSHGQIQGVHRGCRAPARAGGACNGFCNNKHMCPRRER